MMNKVISILCIFLMVWTPTIVYAADPPPTVESTTSIAPLTLGKISQLRKGQHAPFAGVLLSDEAAARLFGEIKFSESECQLRLTKELRINTLQLTSQIDIFKLRLEVETTRSAGLLQVKDQRIKFLEKNWKPTPWYESGEFWFAVGVLGGVLITVGAGYAINQASK